MGSSTKGYAAVDEKDIITASSKIGREIETCIEDSYLKEYDTFLVSPRLVSGSVAVVNSMNKIDEFCQVLLSIIEYDVSNENKLRWLKTALLNKMDEVVKTNGLIKTSLGKHGIDIEIT